MHIANECVKITTEVILTEFNEPKIFTNGRGAFTLFGKVILIILFQPVLKSFHCTVGTKFGLK